MIKICCVTGTRADYPRVRSVLRLLRDAPEFELQIIVTGSHLLAEYGNTVQEIIDDEFKIDARVEMYVQPFDTPYGMTRCVAHATQGIADALHKLQPDFVLLTVDRVETLAAASAAALMNYPIFHIQGGEVTGTIDESIRHAVTKLSHVHFAATQDAASRIVKMGENPEYVFNTGCPYIDEMKSYQLMTKEEVFAKFQFDDGKPLAIMTLHSVTTDHLNALEQVKAVIEALNRFDINILAIYSNADAGGQKIIEYLNTVTRIRLVANIDSRIFASVMSCAHVMVGNSSAGIREAPTFNLPVVNIGNRQNRRERGCNVIDCDFDVEKIVAAISKALNDNELIDLIGRTENIYGDGSASIKIFQHIKTICDSGINVQKVISY